MGAFSFRQAANAAALAGIMAALPGGQAGAQQNDLLPTINVTDSRLGGGIVGTSTTVITADDIERSPSRTLTDILSREPGVQVQNLFGAVNGARSAVDMRGFGAAAVSNTLVLIDGRRVQDADMTGFDFASIPLDSIDRVEITRGNSGAVLYGDGAVGGVINIVTKKGTQRPNGGRIDVAFGSFNHREGNASATVSSGPWSVAAFGNTVKSDGYRENNNYRQHNGVGDIRYTGKDGSVYFNIAADQQFMGLPGGRTVDLTTGVNQLVTDPRGAATPWDYATKDGLNITAGFTRMLAPGVEAIVDGGVRRKDQESGYFFGPPPTQYSFINSRLTTMSVTPRLKIDREVWGLPTHILTGIDYIRADYGSDRYDYEGNQPFRRYDIDQTTLAGYWQQTVTVWSTTDIAFGGRLQWNDLRARDRYNDSACAFGCGDVQGTPLDKDETQYALHAGIEHRFNENVTFFGRAARSFRVPNIDERVGQTPRFAFPVPLPTNFDLETQTSHDIEAGFRFRFGRLDLQSSAYYMQLKNELHYNPILGVNLNLDPTRRTGVETLASWQIADNLRLKGGFAYTDAEFRDGPNAGKEVPLVSRWTGSAGLSWDIWQKWVVFDAVVRYVGDRRLDNDQPNIQPLISDHTLVDLKLGGENEWAYWSIAVQNVFDVDYFDFGIASTAVVGRYSAYPLPGRTFLARFGLKF